MFTDGSLHGGSLKYKGTYGDVQNRISINTASVFLAKDRFKSSYPYSREIDADGNLSLYINRHFLAEARRQLAGVEEPGTSTFGPLEAKLWDEYIRYQNGEVFTGEVELAVLALDKWFIDEITDTPHPILTREYDDTHTWNKTAEYIHDKGILWA